MSAPVLLLQLGEALEPVRTAHGSYRPWFEKVWGDGLTVFDGRNGTKPPRAQDYAGIIISGSAASLAAFEPWMAASAQLVVDAYKTGVPTLGVCFGHQLIAHALAGKVLRNPRGWEIGSLDVELTDEGLQDPLFEGLERTFAVNLSHEDIVDQDSLPKEIRVLGKNDKTDVQMLAASDHVRGVQFHPEFSGAVLRDYIRARRALLDGQDADALIARVHDPAAGKKVVQNFRRHFVEAQ